MRAPRATAPPRSVRLGVGTLGRAAAVARRSRAGPRAAGNPDHVTHGGDGPGLCELQGLRHPGRNPSDAHDVRLRVERSPRRSGTDPVQLGHGPRRCLDLCAVRKLLRVIIVRQLFALRQRGNRDPTVLGANQSTQRTVEDQPGNSSDFSFTELAPGQFQLELGPSFLGNLLNTPSCSSSACLRRRHSGHRGYPATSSRSPTSPTPWR